MRHSAKDIGKCFFQQRQICRTFSSNARRAVGKAQDGVVGGGIAVNAHAVEGFLHGTAKHGLPGIARHLGVSKRHAEHGCHVRADHARALGHHGKARSAACERNLAHGKFGKGIRGHKGSCKALRISGAYIADQFGHCIKPQIHLEMRAHNACRKGQYFIGLKPGKASHHSLRGAAVGKALSAGAGVGLTGISQNSAGGAPACQYLLTHQHRGGFEQVLGEHARQHGGCV